MARAVVLGLRFFATVLREVVSGCMVLGVDMRGESMRIM